MSNLVDYAEFELERAGIVGDDEYDGMIYDSVMDIVKMFSEQGHSGFSAAATLGILEKLLAYEPLTPLTYEDDEWIKHEEPMLWQNRRKSTIFSDDEGQTWYDINEPGTPRHPIAEVPLNF